MHIMSASVFAQDVQSEGTSNSTDTQKTLTPDEKNWAINIYGGVITDGDLGSTFSMSADTVDSHFLGALAMTRTLKRLNKHINIEGEGQIVKHFGDQNHMEFNAVLIGRWLTFPWNSYITTSFAAGAGLSYATDIPEIEAEFHEETSQFLGYLLFELAFSLPSTPHWHLTTRIHHRSGAGGTFNNVHGASNALCFGIKYDF
jgi:hypothetical protein